MIGQKRAFTQQTSNLLYMSWDRLCQFLQSMGVLPQPPTPEMMDSLESAVVRSFKLVEPSESFRASLRDNIEVAIQHQADGIVVEYPYLLRYRVVLGVSAGIVAAAVATLVLVFRPRSRDARH